MNMIEAIAEAGKDWNNWIRPVAWRGCYAAFLWNSKDTVFERVPQGIRRLSAYMPSLTECLGEWEVVTPEVVNTGG